MDNKTFDFEAALKLRQKTLLSSLAEGRLAQNHPTASGDHSELDWRGTLSRFLPNRYRVSQGQVVDAGGTTSEAIDVIIHDGQYTPVLFQREADDEGSIIVPAESVYAVLEAKPEMNKQYLEYASAKIQSVRDLNRTSSPIAHAGGSYPPKPLHRIIGGFLGDSCAWKPCLGKPFSRVISGFANNAVIDLGCALDSGAFDRLQEGENSTIEVSTPDLTLMFFLVRLFERLQRLGTAPAIDIREYARSIYRP